MKSIMPFSQGETRYSITERLTHSFEIQHQATALTGVLTLPLDASGVVLFAHASSRAQQKPRNQYLAQSLLFSGFGVLQFGLMTEREESALSNSFPENHGLMAERLASAIRWARQQSYLLDFSIGCLGFGGGGTVALMAAGALASAIESLVIVDGEPELVGDRLLNVSAPTLLVLRDSHNLHRRMNEIAYTRLQCEKELHIIPDTTSLVGGEALEQVCAVSRRWFQTHFARRRRFAGGAFADWY
jgi:putative phosphoribosyl transferase